MLRGRYLARRFSRSQIETNLFGVIIMTKAALPYFRERRAGHILQITSIGGRIAPIGRAAYAAAKFGVEGFSESLYKEVGPLGIKVTLVEPGGFRCPSPLSLFGTRSTKTRETFIFCLPAAYIIKTSESKRKAE